MADKKISELTAAASVSGSDVVPIVQSSTTKKSTLQVIADWIIQTAASFTQSGSGSPVSRTVQARLRDLVSILDYIPVAEHAAILAQTSTTTLTTYIQAALDAVNTDKRGGLYFPPGLYNTGTINWPGNNIALVGAGSGYGYDTSSDPVTTLKAVTGTTIVLDLVQTGTAVDRQGNYIADIEIDGNAIATVGIDSALANVVERVKVRRCTTAGVRFANFTNSSRLIRCNLNSNSGYGLLVEGASSTTFAVDGCVINSNTNGGIRIEGGFGGSFANTVIESNASYGLAIYRPNTNVNSFGLFHFKNCWLEDHQSTAAVLVDAQSRSEANAPRGIKFDNCHISAPDVTDTYADLSCGKTVTFDNCHFDNSTETAAIVAGGQTYEVGIIEPNGLTSGQVDNVLNNGVRCYEQNSSAVTVRLRDVLTVFVNATERQRLSAAGYSKFSNDGTYNSATGAYHESSSDDSGQPVHFFRNKHASTPNGLYVYFSAAAPDNNTQTFAQFVDNAATRCIIWSDGDIQNHDNSYTGLSDERLKQDIVDSGSQWEDVKNLRVRKYRFKSDVEAGKDHVQIGLIAQEVQPISPGLVTHNVERDEYGVQYSVLYMKAVKALQEAMGRIEKLEAAVRSLQ